MQKIRVKINISSFLLLLSITANAQNKPGNAQRNVATAETPPGAYTLPYINYIRKWEPRMSLADSNIVLSGSRTVREVMQSTQYFDGLGRPLQTVVKGNSTSGKDVVVPVVFDEYGREKYQYLPYTQQSANVNDGKFKTDAFNAQAAFYRNGVLNPTLEGDHIYYNKKDYEPSPLNRVLKTYQPGDTWATKPVETQYLANVVFDSVRIWGLGAVLPSSTTYYPAGQLFKTVTIDENGNKEIVFSDKDNRVILKKVQVADAPGTGHVGWLCTYNVYDDAGNLRFVISPLATGIIMRNGWILAQNVVDDLCFEYQYDERNRMIMKRVPGIGQILNVYDSSDRLAFSQDMVQRAKFPMEWNAFFYDGLGRPVMTAIYAANYTRDALQSAVNGASATGTLTQTIPAKSDLTLNSYDGVASYTATNSITMIDGFDSGTGADFVAQIDPNASETITLNVSKPLPGIQMSALTPLTFSYYDNYNFAGRLSLEKSDLLVPQAADTLYPEVMPSSYSTLTQGKTTGAKIRVLGTNKWLTTTNYYNDKGWPIQVVSENNLGGKNVLTTLYNFNGVVLSTYLRHQNPKSITPQTSVLTSMTFDHVGRLLTLKKRLNGDAAQERTIISNSYDELGRLKLKRMGVKSSGALLDTLNYTYNIRGWIQGINQAFVNTENSTSNWFGLQLSYDYGFTKNQYNGNISGIKSKGRMDSPWAYGYTYDRADRLTAADFTQQTSAGWVLDKKDFSVSNVTYDANGNLLTMNQKGLMGASSATIDQLTYAYLPNTNKLTSVTDPTSTQTKSAMLGDFVDGPDLTKDDYAYDVNGNLTLDLNKGITSVTYNHLNLATEIGVRGKGRISYVYDAGGNKLSKTTVDSTVSPVRITTTDYDAGFVYSRDSIRYIIHEEGRIRPVYKTGSAVTYAYDYFERDHIGNVRTVLTDQTDFTMYAATMETTLAQTEGALFSNIEETRVAKPAGYPEDKTTENNRFVSGLNANAGGKKVGPSIVLKVMAGDTIRINAKAFYKSQGPKENKTTAPMEDMLTGLLNAYGQGGTESIAHSGDVNSRSTPFNADFYSNQYQRLKEKEENGNSPDRPKAYLNFVLFDSDFKMVEKNSGVRQVKAEPDELQELQVEEMPITKSGFLYVYTSNESQQDVFFDNVLLGVNSGPLLEETHYYPFGLVMEGISSNALKGSSYPENKIKFGSKELQNDEFSDGGLEYYDFSARNYNPQIGRWHSADPLADKYQNLSPYNYVANNPVKYLDPDGRLMKDKDGNIIVTTEGKIRSAQPILISNATRLPSGNVLVTVLRRTYQEVTIYADNGTPISALKLTSAVITQDVITPAGVMVVPGAPSSIVPSTFECVSDCHGYTFADGSLWIDDSEVQSILDNDNIYECDVPESLADLVIFKKDQGTGNLEIVHSSKRNGKGGYDNDAGVLTLECDVTLEQAARGLTDVKDSKNVLFVRRRASEAVFDTKLGTVDKNGVRTISNKEEIKQFMQLISKRK